MTRRYGPALEVALAAVRAAGALLRRELHRAGGPRGGGDKAPADAEAETLIRDELEQAFPSHGIVGEELGERDRPAADREKHVWLIDPNDATVAFLEGYRGSSVSLALLRAGQPVLGVVFAFAAPDDEGDLLAWAEGCGPLRRNSESVERPPWATATDSRYTVLLNHKANDRAEANARLVAPLRFRVVPSIAYRLALVAAGEAEVAVSLHAPCAWDYGAGHALLRAVGGELFGEHGQPIRYAVTGRGLGQNVFGGAPAVAPVLARRDWRSLASSAEPVPEAFPLVRPVRGKLARSAALLARAHGCLLGQLAGDSLGALVEFQRAAAIAAAYGDGPRELVDGGQWDLLAGQPTDDGELALTLARTLVNHGGWDEEAVATGYCRWLESDPFDAGTTIRRALAVGLKALRRRARVPPACQSAANPASETNGALMRVSPLAVWGCHLPTAQLAELARADAALTHPHVTCQDASAAYAVAIAHALTTGARPVEVHAFALNWADEQGWASAVRQALVDAVRAPAKGFEGPGWVLVALQNAFYQLLHAPSLEQGVVDTVRRGGDSDTNACIAGALLGAVHGRAAIPWRWQERVLTCRPIAGLPGVYHPRPRFCWPVDALLLAERLVAA